MRGAIISFDSRLNEYGRRCLTWAASVSRVHKSRPGRLLLPMKRILHSLVAIAAVVTVVLGTAPPASGGAAVAVEPSQADLTHPWVMAQTANDLANANTIVPTLFSALKSAPAKSVAPRTATIPPLQRQVFGFAFGNASLGDPTYGYPAWSFNLLTTIAYFGLTVNWDGTIVQSGSGWTTWNSAALTGMVAAAHAAHDRVIVSLNLHDFSASSKSTMCAAPVSYTHLRAHETGRNL